MVGELTKIKERLEKLESRVNELENLQSVQVPISAKGSKLQKLISEKIIKLKPQNLVILILYSEPRQTKEQIKNKFQSLGATKKMINWFKGGNFNQRLIDIGIVFENGQTEEGINMYSLTEGKGLQKALSIIEKLESKN